MRILTFMIISFCMPVYVFATDLTGVAKLEWAPSLVKNESQKAEVTILPELQHEISDRFEFTSIMRIRVDAADRLEPGQSEQDSYSFETQRLLLDDDGEIEIRELYFDAELGDVLLRVGKQQIVWGQADGLKVLDVVNPQSFREFILDDFADSRIPLWSLNAEIPTSDYSVLQLLWLPDTTYDDVADSADNALYAFSSPRFIPEVPANASSFNLDKARRPNNPIKDSDLGFRYSWLLSGFDLTVNYLYHYDDIAVLYQQGSGNDITIIPEYERTHLFGGTFSTAINDLTIRAEIGYSTNAYFVSNNSYDSDGIEESADLSSVIGFDWFGFTDTFLSFQYFQSVLTDKTEGLARDTVDNTVSFNIERSFLNELYKLEILALHNINDGDGLLQSKLNYEYQANMIFFVGTDIFYGSNNGLYGQFADNDRLVFGLEYGF